MQINETCSCGAMFQFDEDDGWKKAEPKEGKPLANGHVFRIEVMLAEWRATHRHTSHCRDDEPPAPDGQEDA